MIVRTGTTPNRCSNNPPQPIEAYIRTPEMFVSHRYPPQPAGSPGPTGTTTVPAPPTPSRSDFADGARSLLNEPGSSDLRRWLEHELSPRCHADPTKATVNVPEPQDGESEASFEACLTTLGLAPTAVELPDADLDAGFGDPVWSSPGYGASEEPGTTIRVYRNPPESRAKTKPEERCRPDGLPPRNPDVDYDPGSAPPGYIGADPDFQPRPVPALPGYPGFDFETLTNRLVHLWWGGYTWGYRHIMIEHGYDAADEADTAAALQDPDPIEEDAGDSSSWLFQRFYNVTNAITGESIHCARSVLVNFYHRLTDPAPYDIITSFYGSYQT